MLPIRCWAFCPHSRQSHPPASRETLNCRVVAMSAWWSLVTQSDTWTVSKLPTLNILARSTRMLAQLNGYGNWIHEFMQVSKELRRSSDNLTIQNIENGSCFVEAKHIKFEDVKIVTPSINFGQNFDFENWTMFQLTYCTSETSLYKQRRKSIKTSTDFWLKSHVDKSNFVLGFFLVLFTKQLYGSRVFCLLYGFKLILYVITLFCYD